MLKLRHYAAGMTIGLATLLTGCADRPMTVPASASLMSEGNGERVSYRPNNFGRVYITDQADGKIVYSGEVQGGEAVELNAREDRVTVGGRTVYDKPLDDGHNFRIFFEPMSQERVVRYRVVEEPVR